MVTNELIDRTILSHCLARWQKTAMIVAKSWAALYPNDDDRPDDVEEVFADRLAILVCSGRLECEGDLYSWRRSELRLPSKE